MTWLPGYFTIQRGLSLQSMGFALMVPWLAALFGWLTSGKISDKIFEITGSKRFARGYWTAGWLTILTISLYLVAIVDSAITSIAFLALASWAAGSVGVIVGPVIIDTVPKQAGSLGGILGICQTTPGIIAPIITGYIVDVTQSFTNAFILAAVLTVSGAFIALFFLKPPSNPEETSEANEPNELKNFTGNVIPEKI